MSVIETADRKDAQADGRFDAHISNENFNFSAHQFNDRKVTGGQIAEAARANPATEYVIHHWLPTNELETIRANEPVDLKDGARFFVIKGDGTERFFVNGLSMEWPLEKIKGKYIKRLAGHDEAEVELVLEREEQDKVIEDDEDVRIGKDGVEELKTRPVKGVTIKVNGEPHKWTKKDISFDEVLTLAGLPLDPTITYSVKYTNGPGKEPDGILAKGTSVRVKDDMRFKAHKTGQS
jgi:hypothetical protein